MPAPFIAYVDRKKRSIAYRALARLDEAVRIIVRSPLCRELGCCADLAPTSSIWTWALGELVAELLSVDVYGGCERVIVVRLQCHSGRPEITESC